MATDILLWIDWETTGLDVESDLPLEVAWKVRLKHHLSEAFAHENRDGFDGERIFPLARSFKLRADVAAMHGSSGLLKLCLEYASTEILGSRAIAAAESAIIQSIDRARALVGEDVRVQLAGNSLHGVDRPFIRKFMPTLEKILHHRHFDISAIRILNEIAGYDESSGESTAAHRAMDDVKFAMVQGLRYFNRTQRAL